MPKLKETAGHIADAPITNRELALVLGITGAMVTKLTNQGFLVKSEKGGYIVKDAVQAWGRYIKGMKSRGEAEALASLEEERTRLTRAQAEKVELENAARNGELLEVDDVISVWSEMLTKAKTKLLAIPTKTAPLVATISEPTDVELRLEEVIRDALTELSEADSTRLLDAGSAEATGEADGL